VTSIDPSRAAEDENVFSNNALSINSKRQNASVSFGDLVRSIGCCIGLYALQDLATGAVAGPHQPRRSYLPGPLKLWLSRTTARPDSFRFANYREVCAGGNADQFLLPEVCYDFV